MRILILYLPVYPHREYKGFLSGGERHVIELCKRVAPLAEICLVTTEKGAEIFRYENIHLDEAYVIHHVPHEEIMQNLTPTLAMIHIYRIFRALIEELKVRNHIDLLIAPSHFIYEVLPLVLAKLKLNIKHAKLIGYIHMVEPPPLERCKYSTILPSFLIWMSQCLSISLLKRYGDTIFVYPADYPRALNIGIPREKLFIMYNGIYVDEVQKITNVDKMYDAAFMARLSPIKGIFDLLYIWERLCNKLPHAKLCIIGSERKEYVSKLLISIKKHKLENNIALLGPLTGVDKYVALKASKVFVYPSYLESWGIVVCEALACGLPVIAYNLPAYTIYKTQATIKVPIGNKDAMVKAILNLLTNDNLRERLSSLALREARKFDWDYVLSREINVIVNSATSRRET